MTTTNPANAGFFYARKGRFSKLGDSLIALMEGAAVIKSACVRQCKGAREFGENINAIFVSMKGDGLRVGGGGETVAELARENQKSPEGILAYFAN